MLFLMPCKQADRKIALKSDLVYQVCIYRETALSDQLVRPLLPVAMIESSSCTNLIMNNIFGMNYISIFDATIG